MKKNYNHINTLDDLHLEVQRLKADYRHREILLKQDAKTYLKQFTPGAIIKKFATPSAFLKFDGQTNTVSSIMSMLLPLILNTTIFKGSGFITKTVAGLVSRKVGKSLDAENLSGIFNAVKSVFTSKKNKKSPAFIDYGIPPDSETY